MKTDFLLSGLFVMLLLSSETSFALGKRPRKEEIVPKGSVFLLKKEVSIREYVTPTGFRYLSMNPACLRTDGVEIPSVPSESPTTSGPWRYGGACTQVPSCLIMLADDEKPITVAPGAVAVVRDTKFDKGCATVPSFCWDRATIHFEPGSPIEAIECSEGSKVSIDGIARAYSLYFDVARP